MARNSQRRRRRTSKGESSSLEGDVSPLEAPSAALPTLHLPKERDADDYRRISDHVLHVAKRIKVLSNLGWQEGVKEVFLAREGKELPRVAYPDRRAEFARAEASALEAADCYLSAHPVDRWLRATLLSHAQAARMLGSMGTPEFTAHSLALYGGPQSTLRDGATTNLDLAQHLLETVEALGVPASTPSELLGARRAASMLKKRLREELPRERIKVALVSGLAAKALAGTRVVRLRRGGTYTRGEIELLVVHEGLVHMATSLNGMHQPLLRCLGRASPRAICLQEGLAVFAEFMAGLVNLQRLQRLADRVVAIDMALDGADFCEVYWYFRAQGSDESSAYEDTRRVFRGGDVEGGAPFTKDVVYLQGAARVRNFFAVSVARGTLDDVQRLFVGKVALEDLDALRVLSRAGWIARPRHLPSWARDTGLLGASLSFRSFFSGVDMASVEAHYASLYPSEEETP